MSRPDLGVVGCEQLAAALGGVADSDVEGAEPRCLAQQGGGDAAAGGVKAP